MKAVYISYCTEHEFGTRPDGFMVSDDLEAMKEKIAEDSERKNREKYWTNTTPKEVWCSKKVYEKIMKRKIRSNYNIAFYNNNEKEKLELYKKI